MHLLKLEDKVADGDAKQRENNFVLSGDEISSPDVNENCVDTVREVLQQKLNSIMPIHTVFFLSAAPLGKPNSAKKAILVKKKSSADQNDVKKVCKFMKPIFLQMTTSSYKNRQPCML